MKRLALPLIAVGILAACGGADAGTSQPATADASPDPTSATNPARTSPVEQPAATPAPSPAGTPAPIDSAPQVAPENVPEALKFAAPLIGGGDIELTTLAGRPVLLWFWAPW